MGIALGIIGIIVGIIGGYQGIKLVISIVINYFYQLKGLQHKALILAAGTSKRWNVSVKKTQKNDEFLSLLYWENFKEKMTSDYKFLIKNPPSWLGSHKSLALLNYTPIITRLFKNFKEFKIDDILVIVNKDTPAQEEIAVFINILNQQNVFKTPIKCEPIKGISDVAHSLYCGLLAFREEYPEHEGCLIVSYSDIILEQALIKELIKVKKKEGDIVILIDNNWEKNYPEIRKWHNKLYSEIVFYKEGKIFRIGEAINRFKIEPKLSLEEKNAKKYDKLFERNRNYNIGEIVGLFKFTKKGRDFFIDEYNKILDSKRKEFPVDGWKDLLISHRISSKPGKKMIHIKKALVGDFLEYFSKQKNGIKLKLIEIDNGWQEIDHWLDIFIAEIRLKDSSPIKLEFKDFDEAIEEMKQPFLIPQP